MDNNEKVDITKHEKLILHMKYIMAISAIICLGSIVLSLFDQDNFVGQVSFGATITSIVLSVIAIWMSISSERSTSDIRVKIAESTERLSGTTKEIETFNSSYKETMGTQLSELKNVQEQLAQIIQSVNIVKEQVSFMSEKNTIDPTTIDNSMMNTSQRIALFNNIYSWATGHEHFREFIFCKMVEIIYNKHKMRAPFNMPEILNCLSQSGIFINFWMDTINTFWGVINTLLAASVFDDIEAENQIRNIESVNKSL